MGIQAAPGQDPATYGYDISQLQGYLPAGTFVLEVSYDGLGYADSTTNTIKIESTGIAALSPTPVSVSFAGSKPYTLTAAGFIDKNI